MSGTNGKGNGRKNGKGNKPETQVPARNAKGHWLKGVSGNTDGRRPGYFSRVRQRFCDILDEQLSPEDERRQVDVLIRQTIKDAIDGNPVALKIVWDRIWPNTVKVEVDDAAGPMATLSVLHAMGRTFAETGQMPKVVDCEVQKDKP